MEKYYFTDDGSYGFISDESIFDTSKWTLADWTEIEECSDSERQFVARGIANKYQTRPSAVFAFSNEQLDAERNASN